MDDDDDGFEVALAERLVQVLELAATKHPPAEVVGATLAAALSFATRRAPVEQVADELAAVAARLRVTAVAERGARH